MDSGRAGLPGHGRAQLSPEGSAPFLPVAVGWSSGPQGRRGAPWAESASGGRRLLSQLSSYHQAPGADLSWAGA